MRLLLLWLCLMACSSAMGCALSILPWGNRLGLAIASARPDLTLLPPYFSAAEIAHIGVSFLSSDAERELYRVTFSPDGSATYQGDVMPDGVYMFVLGPNGGFFARSERTSKTDPFHHATFFANQPIAGAGIMIIAGGRGHLAVVTNDAGCYRGDELSLKQVIREMRVSMSIENLRVTCLWRTGEFRLDYPEPIKTFEMSAVDFMNWTPPPRPSLLRQLFRQ